MEVIRDTVCARKYELGVNLACLKDAENPTRLGYADEYIAAHESREREISAVPAATGTGTAGAAIVNRPRKKQRKR